MSEKRPAPAKPVTFVDRVYRARNIRVGDDTLRVEHGRITVTDPAHVAALEHDSALTRETP